MFNPVEYYTGDLLSWPAGAQPGFDVSHPASKGIAFSSVVLPDKHTIELSRGFTPTYTDTSGTAGIDSKLGPFLKGVDVNYSSIVPSAVRNEFTYACIVRNDSLASDAGPEMGHGNASFYFANGFNSWAFWNGTVATNFGVTPVAGTNYFLLLSCTSGGAWYLLRRALSNSNGTASPFYPVITTGTGLSVSVANTSFKYGRASTAFSSIPAAMISTKYLAQQDAIAWAYNPWKFWYPSVGASEYYPLVGAAATGGTGTGGNTGGMYTMMGIG